MKEYNKEKVKTVLAQLSAASVVFAATSEPGYEMSRVLLLEPNYEVFIVLYGSHCSCYDFDETEWDATEYTRNELKKLVPGWLNDFGEYKALGLFLQSWLEGE